MGPVFRAYDAERERLVAVKLFNLDLPPEKGHQLVAEFERLIAADLTHPALAAPLATGITGVSAFLAQDYVAAESLDLAVREYGSAPPADALRVAAQLAGALDFAAVVNISHGALHPRDVLLSSDDTRLTGIGVARALEVVGVTAPVRRPYTSPERIAGAAWDRRADVFSLAALIHELLWARRVSGTGAHAADSLTDIEGGDLGRLRDTFARALADDPRERFDTALEFAESLKDAFPNIRLTPPTAVDRKGKKGRSAANAEPRTVNPEPRRTAETEPRLPLDVVELDPLPAPALAPPPSVVADVPFDVAEVFRREPNTPDLDLRAAEPVTFDEPPARFEADAPARFQVVEVPVEAAAPRREPDQAYADPSIGPGVDATREPELLSVLDRSRSAVWPLVLALMVGIAMGFAGGYGIGSQRQSPGTPGASAGREFTEGAVTEPAKAPDSTAAPNAGAARADQAKPDQNGVRIQPDAAPTSAPLTTTAAASRSAAPAPRPTTVPSTAPPAAPAASRSASATGRAAVVPPPAEDTGRLLVRSTPEGARVFVDGREAGRTPAALRDMTRGAHRVRVTHDGYVATERRVVISRAHPAQSMAITLVRERAADAKVAPKAAPPASAPGVLQVESRPPGASVYVDGKLVGKTPVSLPAVPAGEHAIRLERDGYKRWSSSVRVVAAEPNRVTASLER